MNYPNIDQVILTFLKGEASTKEIEILREWMKDSKDHKTIFESTKHYWENSHLSVSSSDMDSLYNKLRTMSTRDGLDKISIVHIEKSTQKFKWYKVAAVFVVFFTFAGMVYFLNDTNYQGEEILFVQQIVKENPKGQKLTTYLPDGSKVVLNSQSKIAYNSSYDGTERLIELDGEAFFDVKKDSLKPFQVIANGVTTTALGTSFNVNSKDEQIVEIVLVTGRVKIAKESDQFMILNPGNFAVVSQEGEIKVAKFDYLDKVGWKDGVLAFQDDTLEEIISKLEDWYGVEFISTGEMENDFHYSGTYKNESLEDVLHGISFVHNFKFKIIGDTIKIYTN